jgi:effector-binding domain-containing protein
MDHEVKVQHREPALVLAKRLPITLADIGWTLGAAFGEAYGHIQARGEATDGPPFVIYHGLPAGDEPFDIEICAPVKRAIDPPSGWQLTELPGGTFASLLHVGPYDTVRQGYDTLLAWLGGHDLAVAGPPREVYLSDPSTPPNQIRTVIEFPSAEITAPVRHVSRG